MRPPGDDIAIPDDAGHDTAAGAAASCDESIPEETCKAVYATSGYEASVRNLAQTSLSRDDVFRDGSDHQLATMSGRVEKG